MKKRKFVRRFLICCFILGLPALTVQPAFPAKPGIDIDNDWGAFTWTSNAASPTTVLNHEVIVVDYDGISDDGSSHTVTVKYPEGQTKTLQFSYKTDAYHAVYHLWDSVDPSSDPSAYTGDYVYHVTDVSTGESSEATDYLDVEPINPPDETTFSPKFESPQSITAYFDNVYVNGSLYDDFNTGSQSNVGVVLSSNSQQLSPIPFHESSGAVMEPDGV